MSVFANFSVFTVEPPKSEFQAGAELKALGMTQSSIDNLSSLHNEFKIEFKKVSSDKEATEKYIEQFRAKTDGIIKSMSSEDHAIYVNYSKKYGLDK